MIAVIDYGVGNLFSLTASLKYLGADVKVTGEKEEINVEEVMDYIKKTIKENM